MRNIFFDTLRMRKPRIRYASPAICGGTISSGSGGPSTITLDPIAVPPGVVGLVLTWDEGGGGGFTLNWDIYPGAICYVVYRLNDANDPFGAYHIIAECITDPTFHPPTQDPGYVPGQKACYLIQVITANGSTALSAPICTCLEVTDSGVSPVIVTVLNPATLGPVEFEPENEGATYKWFKDGVFFADTTETTQNELVFPSAQFSDAGSYTLRVTSSIATCGSIESDPIVLQVNPVPPIAVLTFTWGAPTEDITPPSFINLITGPSSLDWDAGQPLPGNSCGANVIGTAPINILGGLRYKVEINYEVTPTAFNGIITTWALLSDITGVVPFENEVNMDSNLWSGVGTASFEFVIPMGENVLTMINGLGINDFGGISATMVWTVTNIP